MCPDSRSKNHHVPVRFSKRPQSPANGLRFPVAKFTQKIHRKACYGVLSTDFFAMRKYQNQLAIDACSLSKQLRKALDVFSFFLRSK